MSTEQFEKEVEESIRKIGADAELLEMSRAWVRKARLYNFTHNHRWLGRPIIQGPQDIYGLQELIWTVKPDLVIETGIAHGGSLVLSASILAMIEYAEAVEAGTMLDPKAPKRKVLGIDIDIRTHNRKALDAHPMRSRIEMIEGSSIDSAVIAQVHARAKEAKCILVCLDSNHTHAHVLAELNAYAPLVAVGSYCIVMDTGIEDLPDDHFSERPWRKGNSPKSAVWEYLKTHPEFVPDKTIEWKLSITAAEDGFLKRVA